MFTAATTTTTTITTAINITTKIESQNFSALG
jgi:hypothetical protein